MNYGLDSAIMNASKAASLNKLIGEVHHYSREVEPILADATIMPSLPHC